MLGFIKELLAASRQTSLERVKNPALGAFVFSWLGFNWQMLAILIFSKKPIELRIEYIQNHWDIGNYLLGPLVTTGLICFMLPRVNKAITKSQQKPNNEVTVLNLDAKIQIANKQQEIADIEARKKLSVEREQKRIENEIEAIIQRNKILDKQLGDQTSEVERLRHENSVLFERLEDADDNNQAQQNRIQKLNSNIESSNERIKHFNDSIASLNMEKIELEKRVKEVEQNISFWADTYPTLFKLDNKTKLLTIDKDNVHHIARFLNPSIVGARTDVYLPWNERGYSDNDNQQK